MEPQTLSVPEAATALGIHKAFAYALIKRGEFPVPVVRVGSRIKVPIRPLMRLLGKEE